MEVLQSLDCDKALRLNQNQANKSLCIYKTVYISTFLKPF